MTQEELNLIIEKHTKWLKGEEGGERAILDRQNLNKMNLDGASLDGASLEGSFLNRASLVGASLNGAFLNRASLNRASLVGASLNRASLNRAFLNRASLVGASLNGAFLNGASLVGASLDGASLDGAKNIPFIPMTCPDTGSFTAWKKANGMIVKLLIPEDARRSSATSHKCRCDKAVVVAIETIDGEPAEVQSVCSDYREDFVYEVGKTVEEPNFCEDRFQECAPGIHFFINRQEAVDYHG